MTSVHFKKYVACGNDFIIIDLRTELFKGLSKERIQHLCHRQFGIGADGIIFLENSETSGYRMRIFNSDGSEAEMCGNGIRCLAHYIASLENKRGCLFTIETMHQAFEVKVEDRDISVKIPFPKHLEYSIKLDICGSNLEMHYLDTGVPHTVLFGDSSQIQALFDLSSHIRFHPHFYPRGTNVNVAWILSDQEVASRTYERGVEQETLACGTGAVAVAIAAVYMYKLKPPITIKTRSGEALRISFSGLENAAREVIMSGSANIVFSGEFND